MKISITTISYDIYMTLMPRVSIKLITKNIIKHLVFTIY